MVKIGVDLKKRDFVWIGLIVILVGIGFVVAEWDVAKSMFHDSADVKITIEGVDYSLQNASDLGLLGGGMKFGSWISKSAASSYEALTDGIVVASAARDDQSYVRGYIGDTSGSLGKMVFAGGWDISNVGSITMPVEKGKFWKVEARGTEISIYWIPIVSSGGGSSGLSCHTVEVTSTAKQVDVVCDYGERTGGGCYYSATWFYGPTWYNTPIDNGWRCNSGGEGSRTTKAYAVCCE